MTPSLAIELARSALLAVLAVGAPLLIAAAAVGLVVGVLQATTQIQDQAISFVCRVAAVILVSFYMLPWMLDHMIEYSMTLIREIPSTL